MLHCVQERGVHKFEEFGVDEDVVLLGLCSESKEPSEFGKVGSVCTVAAASIGGDAFSSDLYPYDGLCIVVDSAV